MYEHLLNQTNDNKNNKIEFDNKSFNVMTQMYKLILPEPDSFKLYLITQRIIKGDNGKYRSQLTMHGFDDQDKSSPI